MIQTIKSLTGAKILITRPKPFAQSLHKLICKQGGQPIILPMISIEMIKPPPIIKLSAYQAVIFTSRSAVDCAFSGCLHNISLPTCLTIIAIGPGTAKALAQHGHTNVLYTNTANSETLLRLSKLSKSHVANQNIAIFSGVGGRNIIEKTLRTRNASTHHIAVYRRLCPIYSKATLSKIWDNPPIDIIVLTSGEGLGNLYKMAQKHKQQLLKTKTVVISERIAELVQKLGFTHSAIISLGTCDKELMAALKIAYHGV